MRRASHPALPATPARSVRVRLHGTTESPEQVLRRREALTATRNINNIQANQPGSGQGLYLRHEELAGSPYASKMRESTASG